MVRDGAVQSLIGNFLMYELLKLAHQKFHYPDVETSERKDLSKA